MSHPPALLPRTALKVVRATIRDPQKSMTLQSIFCITAKACSLRGLAQIPTVQVSMPRLLLLQAKKMMVQ